MSIIENHLIMKSNEFSLIRKDELDILMNRVKSIEDTVYEIKADVRSSLQIPVSLTTQNRNCILLFVKLCEILMYMTDCIVFQIFRNM